MLSKVSHRGRIAAAILATGALLAACSQGKDDDSKSGKTTTTSSSAASSADGTSSSDSPSDGGKTSASSPPASSSSPTASDGTKPSGPSNSTPPGSKNCKDGDPDSCFTPTKLKPGEKPPQFVVFSFDGVGWHEKWQYFNSIADKVPVRFTGFLTGLYLVDSAHKDAYQGPGHGVGKSSLGSFPSKAEVVQEIHDLNDAWARGYEIGTHFNGHFCSDNPPGGNNWKAADWTSELNQFFNFVKNYKKVNGDDSLPDLNVPASSIQGDRTPCLEGDPEVYYPVLKKFGFTYDSSPDRQGLDWPKKGPKTGIWGMGMPDWWIAGTQHYQIMMDYNMWYSQEQATNGAPQAQSDKDSRAVLQSYKNMYNAAYNGNRAPIVIGNHFNDWNNGAYTKAVGEFMQWVCVKQQTQCVPFRDVVRWMNTQDPTVMAGLQALPAELPKKGRDDLPVS